jgi:dephospho-CoA kinase
MVQRIIGLTGGIATGKSTVAHYLSSQHGYPILDADDYARAAVLPGSAILNAISLRYGSKVLNPDGTLHRYALGEIIFNDVDEKAWVEAQIHPYVRQRFQTAMSSLTAAPMVVQVIPLLFEANFTDLVTEIWVVTCSPAVQLARLMERDTLTETVAQARIRNQWPLAEKMRRADVILNNDDSLAELYPQIEQALKS